MSVSQAQLVLQTEARGAAMDGRRRADLSRRAVVVKYGGAAMGSDGSADAWAEDVASLVNGGSRVVVVHGGGPALTRTLQRMGIESSFVDGHRVTSPEAAVVAEMVLAGTINKQVVARLQRAGVRAVGLSGTDGGMVEVRRLMPSGRDLGFVGEPAAVRTQVLEDLLDSGWVPVLAPTAADAAGRPHNINADLVAGAVAGALGAAKLVFLTDVEGVQVEGVTRGRLSAAEVGGLLTSGEASGGMRPKLEASLAALAAGVAEVLLVDGRVEHVLAAALLASGGSGTWLTTTGD